MNCGNGTWLLNLSFASLFMQKAPIDPFTRISCKPSASQGVPLGGMGYVVDQRRYLSFSAVISDISEGFQPVFISQKWKHIERFQRRVQAVSDYPWYM